MANYGTEGREFESLRARYRSPANRKFSGDLVVSGHGGSNHSPVTASGSPIKLVNVGVKLVQETTAKAAKSKAEKSAIFVAYPYSISKADYRGAFKNVAKQFGVEFLYADARITNRQILDKIVGMIEESEFSIFDVTHWNANVALELGVAIGGEKDYYILFTRRWATIIRRRTLVASTDCSTGITPNFKRRSGV